MDFLKSRKVRKRRSAIAARFIPIMFLSLPVNSPILQNWRCGLQTIVWILPVQNAAVGDDTAESDLPFCLGHARIDEFVPDDLFAVPEIKNLLERMDLS